MKKLSKQQLAQINEFLSKEQALPEEYKNLLFESKKEYELVYGGKEREEDIIAETMAVPLQPVKTLGKDGKDNGWVNKLIFGDNLQVLRSLYNDPEVKGKVKLIYIDPPFGTGDEYGFNESAAYSAKTVGAKFIEFLRKRLVLLRELLAEDGSIYVRMDYHFGHYVKVVMDEIFGQENFLNEIVINRFKRQLSGIKKFNVATDSLFFYSKSNSPEFKEILRKRICSFCGQEVQPAWRGMSSPGLRRPPERIIFGKKMLPPQGRHWTFTQERIEQLVKEKRIRMNEGVSYTDLDGNKVRGLPEYLQTEDTPVDSNWTDLKGYVFNAKYPTENPEELLERVLKVSSDEGDLVIDVFAGSGTTLSVAEKLKRHWIGVDCGKLSIYTMQKRILNLREEIGNKGKPLTPKPFTVYNAGLYDYKLIKDLPWNEYRDFALKLFQCRDEEHKASGVKLDGYLGEDHVLVFQWHDGGEIVLDRGFIDDLHKTLGKKVGQKFFIIAPASTVVFLEDYIEKDNTKYYLLRIPYSIIEEIHEHGFEAIKQPVSEADVNDVVDAVGFDFIQTPDVECEYKIRKADKKTLFDGDKEAVIKIKKFKSNVLSRKPVEFKNLETLSMVMVDYNFNGEVFDIDQYWFAESLEKDGFEIRFDPKKVEKQMMIIYMDIFGNEKREVKTLKDFK